MLFLAHVDEVIDDHTAQVAQSQLPCNLLGGLNIHSISRFLGRVVRAKRSAVDVDRDQCLGLIDDNRAAGPQWNFPLMDAANFRFQLVLMKQRLLPSYR